MLQLLFTELFGSFVGKMFAFGCESTTRMGERLGGEVSVDGKSIVYDVLNGLRRRMVAFRFHGSQSTLALSSTIGCTLLGRIMGWG